MGSCSLSFWFRAEVSLALGRVKFYESVYGLLTYEIRHVIGVVIAKTAVNPVGLVGQLSVHCCHNKILLIYCLPVTSAAILEAQLDLISTRRLLKSPVF